MNDVSTITIKSLIVHQAGNAAQGGRLLLSDLPIETDENQLAEMLIPFLLKPINEAEQYRMEPDNLVYTASTNLFADKDQFVTISKQLAEHFHLKSSSAFAKSGELYVALFQQVPFGDQFVSAIGLFHTSHRESFLQPNITGDGIRLKIEEGIELKKPEKAVLIFNQEVDGGLLTYAYESSASKQGEGAFWKHTFLQITPLVNSYYNTNAALGMCKLFISNELNEQFETTKSDQIDMLQRSMEYFKTHDNFQIEEFGKEVLHHPEVIDCFNDYKQQYEVAKQVSIDDSFDINLEAVQKQQRQFKSILKLDKNFHVYIHGRKDLMEKGYDEKTGKHYYKLYFDEEK